MGLDGSWLPSAENHRENTQCSARALLQAAFWEAQNARQAEVGNTRVCVSKNLKNGPPSWLQMQVSGMAVEVCARCQTGMWLLACSVLKTEYLEFQGQAWVHTMLKQTKINILYLWTQLIGNWQGKHYGQINSQRNNQWAFGKERGSWFLKTTRAALPVAFAYLLIVHSSLCLSTCLSSKTLKTCISLVSLYLACSRGELNGK